MESQGFSVTPEEHVENPAENGDDAETRVPQTTESPPTQTTTRHKRPKRMVWTGVVLVLLVAISLTVANFVFVMQVRQHVDQDITKTVQKLDSDLDLLEQKLKELESDAYPTDCTKASRQEAKVVNETGGVFDVFPPGTGRSYEVYCDLVTDGGGWTVFQRRMDGSENFDRNWTDYVDGFGRKDGEFWLGLEALHQMTMYGEYELRVLLGDWKDPTYDFYYGKFSVGSSSTNYQLHIGEVNSSYGDSLSKHDGAAFSTRDRDNDQSTMHCAEILHGGWWFFECLFSNLNGLYKRGYILDGDPNGVVWLHLFSNFMPYSLKFTEMKFRRKGDGGRRQGGVNEPL